MRGPVSAGAVSAGRAAEGEAGRTLDLRRSLPGSLNICDTARPSERVLRGRDAEASGKTQRDRKLNSKRRVNIVVFNWLCL